MRWSGGMRFQPGRARSRLGQASAIMQQDSLVRPRDASLMRLSRTDKCPGFIAARSRSRRSQQQRRGIAARGSTPPQDLASAAQMMSPPLNTDRQGDADIACGWPDAQQNAGRYHDPQDRIGPLSDGDRTRLATPEEPLKKSLHDHDSVRTSVRAIILAVRPHPRHSLSNR